MVPVEVVIEHLANNPRHDLHYNILRGLLQDIIPELNSRIEHTSVANLIKLYQQLVTLTQYQITWRHTLEDEIFSFRRACPELYLKLTELYIQYPLTSPPKPETITLSTLVQALQKFDPVAITIINKPTNALTVVALILSLIDLGNQTFSQLKYKPFYSSTIQDLAQFPTTLKKLLAIIEKYPHNIQQETLDLIDHILSSYTNTNLQTIWLEWLYNKHSHSLFVHQRLIRSIFRWSSSQNIPDKYYVLFEEWWENTLPTTRNRILDLENIDFLQDKQNTSPEYIKKVCFFWGLHIQQLIHIFSRLQTKNPQFSHLSDELIDIWSNKIRQWIKFIAVLDHSQEDSLYLSLYTHIQILQVLETFDQCINPIYLIKHDKLILSQILKNVDKKITEIIQQHIQKQETVFDQKQETLSDQEQETLSDQEQETVSDQEQETLSDQEQETVSDQEQETLSDLSQVTQSLSDLQEKMQYYQVTMQQLNHWDPQDILWKTFQALQEKYIKSIQASIYNDQTITLDQKYKQWQNAVSKTRLEQQSFPTYQNIENSFEQIQKDSIANTLENLKQSNPTIKIITRPSHDYPSNSPTTIFVFENDTLSIHYDF